MYNGEGKLYILLYNHTWQVIEINKLSSTQNIEMKSYQKLEGQWISLNNHGLGFESVAGDILVDSFWVWNDHYFGCVKENCSMEGSNYSF